MGQKINPIGLRLQVNRTWDSRWFADGTDYGKLLHEDLAIREFIKKNAAQAGISRVIIERPHSKCRVTIHAARPGVIIGKKGADIEVLRKKLAQFTKSELHLNIVEIRKPEIDAALVAENIAQQLERRVSLPPRDEAGGAERHAHGRARHPDQRRRPPRRRRDRPDRVVPRGPGAAAHAARGHRLRALPRPRPPTGSSGSRSGSSRARSWSTIRRRATAARPNCRKAAGVASAAFARARPDRPGEETMLQPKRTKFRKQFKGRIHGEAKGGTELNFGHFGLKATEPDRITARQIEAARRALTRHMKRQGRVWIRIFPDVPVSKKPTEVRMGKGKGAVEFWAAKVKPGRIMFEIDGVDEDVAKEALRLAAMKLPIKCRFVAREDW